MMRPDNYGTLSALILHLMRTVIVTPFNIPPYVKSALDILHRKRVMERFGMFFIDDLDPDHMERIHVNLGAQDSAVVKKDHKAALATRILLQINQGRGIQLTESHTTEDYPWGETIPWRMLQRLLKEHVVDFLLPFDFHQVSIGLGPLDLIESLFTDFTREAWLGFHESFLPAGVRPNPTNLKESMETWTCRGILARLGGKCTFFPSTYNLDGAPRSKGSDMPFKALRSLFFPTPGQRFKAKAIWEVYSGGAAYIGKYWEILNKFKEDPDMVQALHDGIDQIFEQLQCLPQSKGDSNLWHAIGGSVCFLTNPHYYRIKAISVCARKLPLGPQRPQVSLAELHRRLNPHNRIGAKRKRGLSNKRSAKRKNHRKPPKKKQRIHEPSQSQPRQIAATQRTKGPMRSLTDSSEDSDSETTDSSDSNSCTSDSTQSHS
jgi:hypothetical protein